MKRVSIVSVSLTAALLAASSLVQAQATRTWVSGVGDDVNPCSRTAPCKTWAGAISKTAAGGEINALDPAGFGSVTITKSITIDGSPGPNSAGVLNSGTFGVQISAAAGDSVTLRNLSIDGANTGTVGIRINTAGQVFIENTQVFGQNGRGIDDRRSSGQLFVEHSILKNNNQTGIVILPISGSTSVDAILKNVRLTGNGNSGLTVGAGARVTLSGSVLSGNVNYGLYVEQPAGSTQVFALDSTFTDNQTGIVIGPGSPTVRMSNLVITNNDVGINPNFVTIFSYSNNKISGNVSGNGPFSPALSPLAQQ